MSYVRWTPAMSVGEPRLDRDHRVLIGLINRVESARDTTVAGGGTRHDVLADVLATLIAYTVFHFGREEQVMAACGYPDLDVHRDEHEALTAEVRALAERFAADPLAIPLDDVLAFLRDWLSHHILLQDMAYRDVVNRQPEAAAAAAAAYGDFDFAAAALAASEPELEDAS
ncbi:MAG: hypothetical protein EA405_09820 [Rhodospirillales bacterium]|nr:MAG: hypothetical protein EA405_09820 [Rhodospirillales bacterium]